MMKYDKKIGRAIKLLSDLFKNHTFIDFIKTIKTAIFRNDLIYVFAIDTDALIQNGSGNSLHGIDADHGVVIKKGDINELNDFCNRTGENAWEFKCYKYDGVKDFFIARDANTIRCITWIYRKDDFNRFLIMGEEDALLQYGLTLPQYRGQRLLPAVLQAIAKYLKNQGCKKVYVLIECRNNASIKGTTRAGFVKVGQMRLIKIFGIQISKKLDVSKIF